MPYFRSNHPCARTRAPFKSSQSGEPSRLDAVRRSVAGLDPSSYWIDSAALPRFPTHTRDLEVDAIVVGGGITGITAAYLLKQAGLTVALLERERCARIDTGHTTAHLTSVTDLRLQELDKTFGLEAARAVWDAGATAIDQIVNLIRAEGIACDFRWVPGFLHAPVEDHDGKATPELEQEAAVAKKLGISAIYLSSIPFFQRPGVKFPQQAIFHPRKYLAALARKIPGAGSHVFERCEAEEIAADPLAVKAGKFWIRGKYLVLATHTPLTGNTGLIPATLFQTKLSYYSSYALGAKIPSGLIPEASFWDTGDPYGYLRVERRRGYDYAIYGGEDHKTGQVTDTAAVFQRLEDRFREFAPAAKIDHRWSGQVIETNDGLPYIGETAEHQFAATGFSGNGMTFGTLGAMMAVDAALKRKNPWQDLFDIHRKKLLGGTWDYLKENKDYPYYMLRDWMAGAEGDSLGELPRNQGKILNLDGKKVAAYRDGAGHVSLCSPVCTHLKCIVGWNEAERTWDCPCHGSRFKPSGEVISGPAEEPLEKISRPK
jgi:glycine/D-amino acid oxidase-like deaminating enzyme/nitrite reductase/ring-hydroxylating ferredoxin subunit